MAAAVSSYVISCRLLYRMRSSPARRLRELHNIIIKDTFYYGYNEKPAGWNGLDRHWVSKTTGSRSQELTSDTLLGVALDGGVAVAAGRQVLHL